MYELKESSNAIEREFYDFYRTPRGEFTPGVPPAGHVDLYDRRT